MKYIYKITTILGSINVHSGPPPIIAAIFSLYDGSQEVIINDRGIYVTFDAPQTPADLGPLVRVELVTDLSTLP
jgi:hypothetical protein